MLCVKKIKMFLKFWKRRNAKQRKALLKVLGKDRYFICMASDAYRPPAKRHSFGKWVYRKSYSNEEQAVYQKNDTYVISFRGTAEMHDNLTNIKLIMGKFFESSRFKRDLAFVRTFHEAHPKAKLILTGHSLGGRLASELVKQLKTEAKSKIEGVTFNEARVAKDLEQPDNHKMIRRYRTASDAISAFGIVGEPSKQTHFKPLPSQGHSIVKLAKLICHPKPSWSV